MADQKLTDLPEETTPADTDLLYLVTSGSPQTDRKITVANLRGAGGGGDPADTIITPDTYANLPAAGTAGRVFLPTDSFYLLRDSGAAWVPWGPIFPMTPPPALSAWTWVNQGSATASETNGGIHLATPAASGENLKLLVKSAPSPPYTVTVAFAARIATENFQSIGLAWRDSSGGKVTGVTFGYNSTVSSGGISGLAFRVYKWDSPTVFGATYSATPLLQGMYPYPLWLRIADDGVNRTASVSADGQNFVQFFTVTRTDFHTPDQVGIMVNSGNATHGAAMTLFSWAEA